MKVPVIHSQQSIGMFLNHVRRAGPTPKTVIDRNYLAANGFTTTHTSELIGTFKGLGFISNENQPTTRWAAYATGSTDKTQEVLRTAVREVFSDLLDTIPNAYTYEKDETTKPAIVTWFQGHERLAYSTAKRAERMFRTLGEHAGLLTESSVEDRSQSSHAVKGPARLIENPDELKLRPRRPGLSGFSFQLPATENIEVYRAIFKAYSEV